MAQAVSRRTLTAEAVVRARVNPCGICGKQSGTGTGFSPSCSVFPLSISFRRRSRNSYHLRNEQLYVSGSSSDTWSHPIIINQRCDVPKDIHLHTCRRGNLRSQDENFTNFMFQKYLCSS
jgi:hypothetical protein